MVVIAIAPALSLRVTAPATMGAPVAAVPLRVFPPAPGEEPPPPPLLPLPPHHASSPMSNRPKNVAEANPRREHGSAGSAIDDECARMGTIGTLIRT